MLLSPPAFGLFLFLVFFLSAFFFDFWFPSPSAPLYITSLSVLCFFFFVFLPLSLVLPRSRFLLLCSAASGSGVRLLKTVKTMVNAGSRLYAFVRWAEFTSPLPLVWDSVTFSSEMKGQRRLWGCSLSLRRSSAFLSGFSSAQDEGDGDKSMTFCRLNVSSLWFFFVFFSFLLLPILGSALSHLLSVRALPLNWVFFWVLCVLFFSPVARVFLWFFFVSFPSLLLVSLVFCVWV